jgi:hypothetical protein
MSVTDEDFNLKFFHLSCDLACVSYMVLQTGSKCETIKFSDLSQVFFLIGRTVFCISSMNSRAWGGVVVKACY